METHKRMTLEEFKNMPPPEGTERLLSRFNGGTFMECHQAIFASTGIWVEELVPVFQKLDTLLISRRLGPS